MQWVSGTDGASSRPASALQETRTWPKPRLRMAPIQRIQPSAFLSNGTSSPAQVSSPAKAIPLRTQEAVRSVPSRTTPFSTLVNVRRQ